MTVGKIITKTEPQELEITGATLLSVKEAVKLPKDTRVAAANWWLRSPSYFDGRAAFVAGSDGIVREAGYAVSNAFGVRPALRISGLESSAFKTGDRFELGGHSFTVVSDQYALCEGIIGRYFFRDDWKVGGANDYEKSDVKKYVDRWFDSVRASCMAGAESRL